MANDGTQTPAKVSQMATERAALPRTALIGVFGNAAAPGALVRERNGSITRVTIGDSVAGGVVAAIGEDALVLSSRSGNKVLRLPKG